MKKIVTLSLALSALIFTATAQEQREIKKDKKAGMERHQGKRGNSDMMKDLNLSETQQAQLKASREEYKTKMDQLKTQNLSEAQLKEKRIALMTEQKAKMQSILTAEQKAKMEAKKKSFEGKKGEGRNAKFKGKEFKGSKGDKTAMLKEKLSLTDDQVTKLKAQQSAIKAKREAIKNNTSLSKEAKKEQMTALKKEAKLQRSTIFTKDQLNKLESYKKDRKDKDQKRAKK